MGRSVKAVFRKFKERFFRLQTVQFTSNLLFVFSTLLLLYIQSWKFEHKLIVFLVLYGIYYLLQQLLMEVKNNKLPTVQKRYTFKTENGGVYIHPKDYHQAILRLAEFEDYMQE